MPQSCSTSYLAYRIPAQVDGIGKLFVQWPIAISKRAFRSLEGSMESKCTSLYQLVSISTLEEHCLASEPTINWLHIELVLDHCRASRPHSIFKTWIDILYVWQRGLSESEVDELPTQSCYTVKYRLSTESSQSLQMLWRRASPSQMRAVNDRRFTSTNFGCDSCKCCRPPLHIITYIYVM